MTIPKINYIAIAPYAAIAVLSFFLFRGCSDQIDWKQEKKMLRIQQDSVSRMEQEARKNTAIQQKLINTLSDSIAHLVSRQVVTSQKLEAVQQINHDLSKQVKVAKLTKDTVLYYASCDSLSDRVDTLIEVQKMKDRQADSLKSLYTEQLSHKDTIIQQQQDSYSYLRQKFNEGAAKEEACINNEKKLQRKNNFNKTLSRGLAGVAIGLIAALMLKK